MSGASQPPPGLVPQLYRALFGPSASAASRAPSLIQARAQNLLRQAAREQQRALANETAGGRTLGRLPRRTFSTTFARSSRRATSSAAVEARRAKSDERPPAASTTTTRASADGRSTFPVDASESHPSASCSKPPPNEHASTTAEGGPTSVIKELMRSPDLYPPDFRPPRLKVVLCHGLYGYGVRGQIHYWANVQDVLAECGVDLLVVEVPSYVARLTRARPRSWLTLVCLTDFRTGSIEERAKILHQTLEKHCPHTEVGRWHRKVCSGRVTDLLLSAQINFLAHSMVGHPPPRESPESSLLTATSCATT